jgi:hypothetical protein
MMVAIMVDQAEVQGASGVALAGPAAALAYTSDPHRARLHVRPATQRRGKSANPRAVWERLMISRAHLS